MRIVITTLSRVVITSVLLSDAKAMRFDNLRGVRYCEVFVIGGTIYPKNLQGAVYNT